LYKSEWRERWEAEHGKPFDPRRDTLGPCSWSEDCGRILRAKNVPLVQWRGLQSAVACGSYAPLLCTAHALALKNVGQNLRDLGRQGGVNSFLEMSDGVKLPGKSAFGYGPAAPAQAVEPVSREAAQVLASAFSRFGKAGARQIGQALGILPYDASA
jgi:hypothetical protein